MKKLIIMLAVLAMSVPAMAQISGSLHDFSGVAWAGGPGGEICITCHTPHNADTAVADSPLWNHEVTVASFTLYSSGTFDGADTIGQPNGVSKLCLSCHDGTVALDNFGGATGGTNFISTGLVGTDLSTDHPTSFTYDAALATDDGELYDPTTANSGLGSTIAADLLDGGTKLECSSCHDVHDAGGFAGLLVMSNKASALCLTCHIK